MENVNRVKSVEQPDIFLFLGDGTFWYNYDIQSCKVSQQNAETNESEEVDGYEYTPIMCAGGVPDYKSIVQKVLRTYVSSNEEFDLINSYYDAINSGETDSDDIKKYKEYLEFRNTLKAKVKSDIEKYKNS